MTDEEGRAWRSSHYKIPEGFRMTTWPSFLRLMEFLGVEVPQLKRVVRTGGTTKCVEGHYDEDVVIDIPCGDKPVTVSINGRETLSRETGFSTFRSLAAQKYFDLLGIPWYMYVVELRIEFAVGRFPLYTMKAALATPKNLDSMEPPLEVA